MKNNLLKICVLLFVLMHCRTAFGSSADVETVIEQNGVYYTIVQCGNDSRCVEVAPAENRYADEVIIPISINHDGFQYEIVGIADNAFYGCNQLKRINYEGTRHQWLKLWIGEGNDILNTIPINYNYIISGNDTVVVHDNYVYTLAQRIKPGEQISLSINMKNSKEITGFQFEFKLPDSFALLQDEKGNYKAKMSSVRTTPENHNIFEIKTLNNGRFLLLCSSTSNSVFTGSDGEVATIDIEVDSNVPFGLYNIQLYNIAFSDKSSEVFRIAQDSFLLQVSSVNTEELQKLIAEVELYRNSIVEQFYDLATILDDAIDTARITLNDIESTQMDIDAAVGELQRVLIDIQHEVIRQLRLLLGEKIQEANSILVSIFHINIANTLQEEISKAIIIYDDTTASREDIEYAIELLKRAIKLALEQEKEAVAIDKTIFADYKLEKQMPLLTLVEDCDPDTIATLVTLAYDNIEFLEYNESIDLNNNKLVIDSIVIQLENAIAEIRAHHNINHYVESACGVYVWKDRTIIESGIYYDTLQTQNGCDSIDVLHLTLFPSVPTTYITDTVCSCESYVWYGKKYDASGIYTMVFESVNGCDSIVELNLVILPIPKETIEEATIISGEYYQWNNNSYSIPNKYSIVLPNVHGCDSVATLKLKALPLITYDTICWQPTYSFMGYDFTIPSTEGFEEQEYVDCVLEYRDKEKGLKYQHMLAIKPKSNIGDNIVYDTICANEPYLWNGITYTSTGSYTDTLQSVLGCDSIVTLNLTVLPAFEGIQENVTICYSENYEWNGTIYTESGIYTKKLKSICGCDSIVSLNLTVLPKPIENVQSLTIPAEAAPYEWYQQYCTNSGTYYHRETYRSTLCDSIVNTLHLIVLPQTILDTTNISICANELPYTWNDLLITGPGQYMVSEKFAGTQYDSARHILDVVVNPTYTMQPIKDTICYGETYIWNNMEYDATGTYSITLTSVTGCDSVVTLHLTVNNTQYAEETVTACDSYTWNGETYTENGEYTYTTTANNGCDSIVTLHLTINRSITTEQTEVACDSYTWTDGKTYTKSGTYYQYLQTIHGCDSTVVLHLTINRSIEVPYEVTACDSYTWSNGITYTQSGVYYDSLKTIHGCDSVEILTLTINYSDTAYFSATSCDSYVWHDKTYTTSGTYEYLTQTVHGCDSIEVLTLTINRSITTEQTEVACDSYTWTDGKTYTKSGTYYQYIQTIHGCDSTVTLHLTINNTKYTEETATACDNYTWNGETYTTSGEYVYTTTASNGCDSIVTLHLTINNTKYTEETATACDNYTWNGETYTTSGEYVYTTTASNGCDSIVTLHLTINNTKYTEETATACDNYTWNGETYTTSGEYVYTTTAANGCDSIVTLHLTINNTKYTEETATACDNYTWNGETYTTSGEYVYTTTASNGCDSIVTLHLTVNYTQYAEETVTACDSYLWNGETYTASGEYTYTTTATNGCDSIVTLHLTINNTKYTEETVTACDSYTWNGETYTASGGYTYTTTAANGCDSIVTLHLTINATKYAEETVTACDAYTWNGETYTESGEYTYTTTAANGCDSIVTLHLTINNSEIGTTEYITICYGETYTWNGQTYAATGEYSVTLTNAAGCDSVATLYLTIMPEAVTTTETIVIGSDELPYTWRGKEYMETGLYTYVEQYAHVACDSAIHVLDLTVLTTGNFDEESITICETETPYQWYGQAYTATGKYTYTEKYAGTDIDSVQHILNLTVNPTQYTEETVVACDSYTWNGETYSKSGEYTYTTTASNDCDSIVTLHLTVNQTQYAEETVVACDSYAWNGETYTTSGEYTYTTTAANECDSIVTLHLTINNSEIGVTEYATICYGETYTWNGQMYAATGEYSVTLTNAAGCDSIATLYLTIMPEALTITETVVIGSDDLPYTWRGNTYLATGRYTDVEQYTHVDCDSAIHVLDLTVLTTGNFDEESITICETETPYIWYGESYTATGKYTYTEKYAGTDIDSVQHILNLTVNPTKYAEETVTACDAYTWNGETYTESGEYTYTTTAANGCDSIVTLHLTINNSEIGTTEYITICYGETYTWNGQTYAATGEYSVTLTNAAGCDSVATLYLTIMPEAVTTTETIVIGSDELPYTWRGKEYMETGLYTYVEQYAHVACDSAIHVLDLTVLTTGNFDEESITICETETPYQWYGQAYTATGKYTYTEKYAGTDIDSVQHILNLTVNPTQYTEETVVACDSYTWNGETYSKSGEYTYTTTASNDCDSIVTLHLTVNQTQYAEETVVACDSYAWNGETYTTSGEYTYTTTAANECDSIVTLHLTINNSEIGVTEYATICYGETYTWNGQMYAATGEYSVTLTNAAGCDSIATLYLTIMPEALTITETVVIGSDDLPYTWRGNTYLATGRYTDVEQYTHVDCDSAIHVLDLTVLTTGNFDEESITICETETPYIWYGESYTATGKYTYTEKYAGTDIDSVQHILNLTVNPTQYTEETVVACDSYAWNGETYTESGEYTYTTTAANGCDSIITLYLTINQTQYAEETVTACDSYTWNGETYTESGDYTYNTTSDQGCERIEVLHLTILPEATTESEEIALCPSELPYEWCGQTLTEAGLYTATEQYAGMDCDSVIHELTLNVYVQTLPAQVTLPIVRTGEAIDVTIPTAEIQAHIAAETWYAPNAEVAWYILENSDWAALTTEPVMAGTTQVVLKYAVETDCGFIESNEIKIQIEPTDVENISQSADINIRKVIIDDKVYILREGKIYSLLGTQVTFEWLQNIVDNQ